MRAVWKWALVLAVPAAFVTAGQPTEKIVPEGTAVPLILLRQKSVQKELKLSPEVTEKVFKFTAKQWKAAQKAMKAGKEERKEAFDQLEKENKKFLAATLSKGQHKRLDQIALQVTGLFQLTRPEIVKALNLTEEQQQKFKQMQKEARKGLAELLHAKGAERNEELAKHRKATRARIMALLTDEQKAQVRALVGPPFEGEIVIEQPK
jgi:hypothetical protein